MSGRKKTKRKNSDDDFFLDDDAEGAETSDINTWSCQSCTFMNRAAAYKCLVCGTRKGTSTRRSRVNDNVVEMQKTITDMVQKQNEKEKMMKRRERSLFKSSSTRESDGLPSEEVVVKEEPVNTFEEAEIAKPTSSISTPLLQEQQPLVQSTPVAEPPREKRKYNKKPKQFDENGKVIPPVKKQKGAKATNAQVIDLETEIVAPTPNLETLAAHEIKMEIQESETPSCSYKTPTPQPIGSSIYSTSQSPVYPDIVIPTDVPIEVRKPTPPKETLQDVVPTVPKPPTDVPTVPPPFEGSILHLLPERIVKKLNQPFKDDLNTLMAKRKMTGIDPIVADAEAIVLPQDWDRQKVFRGLMNGSNHYVSPATSRQSSETDSSSEANRSFETPLNDVSVNPSKSCQIPDYMIHRDAPQKIFIVANGFPAYFEEFPRRLQ